MWLQWLSIVAGVGVLYAGGEILVRYASSLARALGVRPLVIGLTVIAFGTSAPELAAAVIAAAQGLPAIAVGNVVGSNIANIGLILGVTVVISPLVADRVFIRREVPFMLGTAVVLLAFVLTGELTRLQALVLLALMVLFMWVLMRGGGVPAEPEEGEPPSAGLTASTIGSVVGLALLVGGAQILVWGAASLARGFGMSERVIGLTVVAFGTSVPELAGCLVAAARKQADLVVGNIIGSNVFNTLLILPAAILVRPMHVDFSGFGIDIVVMLGFSLVLLLFFLSGDRLVRSEGAILGLAYLGYVGYLASQPAAS